VLRDGEVVVSLGKRIRTLHRAPAQGGCYRIPGVHYHHFQIFPQLEAAHGSWDWLCQMCFNQASSQDSSSTGSPTANSGQGEGQEAD